MKILRLITCAILAIGLSANAKADVGSALMIVNGATGNIPNASATVVDTSKVSFIRAHVYSAAGSTAVVKLRQRSTSSAPWEISATVTDPSGPDSEGEGGEYWILPVGMQFSATVTGYSAGTVFVVLETHQISN